MHRKHVSAFAFWLIVAPSVSVAQPWSLGDGCGPANRASQELFVQTVKAAKPGSTVYVPKPYPTTDRQVILDFLYQFKQLHLERTDPRRLPDNELPVLNAVLNSRARYAVQRVENWTPTQCSKEQRRDFYFLLRIFDAAGGAELARIALNATGLLSMMDNYYGPIPLTPLPELAASMAETAAAYNLHGEVPEYVTTLGSISCLPTRPCLAFRQGDDGYILYKGALYQLASSAPRLVQGRDVGTIATSARVMASLRDGESLVSLGGSAWTVARRLEKPIDPPSPTP
jgi:hypothetical protein